LKTAVDIFKIGILDASSITHVGL